MAGSEAVDLDRLWSASGKSVERRGSSQAAWRANAMRLPIGSIGSIGALRSLRSLRFLDDGAMGVGGKSLKLSGLWRGLEWTGSVSVSANSKSPSLRVSKSSTGCNLQYEVTYRTE
jgi:hypothetical protein